MDFACKKISMDEILKCGLNLTKSEINILKFFLKNKAQWVTTELIADELQINLSTAQRAVKKLSEKNILIKSQKNLEHGGYIFDYKIKDKKHIKDIVMNVISNWTNKVEKEICNW